MSDPAALLVLIGAGSAGLALSSLAALRGWRGWLELKRLELAAPASRPERSLPLAALRERVRRLEAIAEGRA